MHPSFTIVEAVLTVPAPGEPIVTRYSDDHGGSISIRMDVTEEQLAAMRHDRTVAETTPPIRVRRPGLPGGNTPETTRSEPTPAPPQVTSVAHVEREGKVVDLSPGFVAREGDSLVVTYPEVTLPLPKQYAMMRFGGAIYSRRLHAGDDPQEQFRVIDEWLTQTVETAGRAKYRRLIADFAPRNEPTK